MDEYISKEVVLKAFRLTAKNSNKDYQRGLQDAIDCLVPEVIADIPAADVQPVKHAHWYAPVSTDPVEWCSSCKERTRWAFDEGFCPNCGARMDGDPSDE